MTIITVAQVKKIHSLTGSIIELILAPDEYVDYQAGQYLQIVSNNQNLYYSIANAPLGSRTYELHIRHDPQNASNKTLFAEIKKNATITLALPFGDCHLNRLDSEKPIIFIAGGTGFAPIKAMIEQLLANGDQRTIELYWSARSQSDLYMDEQAKQWQAHVNHFHYFSLLSMTSNEENLVSMVMNQHPRDLQQYQVVINGPFDLVYLTRDALIEQGVLQSNLFSDALSFEKKGSS